MINFAKSLFNLQNPEGLERALIGFLNANGYLITKSKSFGGIVAKHAQTVVGVGTQVDFFTGALVANDTNLNSFLRPEGEYMIVMQVKASDGANATVAATAWTPGFATGELLNGDFTIQNNGIKTLNRIPNTQFVQAVENPYSGVYDLPFPNVWAGQEQFVVEMRFPVAPAVANTNVLIELIGLGLVA